MEKEQFEAAVIGAGPGGYVCAIRLAQLGVDTVMVDRGNPGGVCLNWGCIPSKAFIHVANEYESIQHAERYGIHAEDVRVDMSEVQSWKERVVSRLTQGVEHLMNKAGVEIIYGDATFQSSDTVHVEKEGGDNVQVEADNFVIATGSSPIEIPGFSYDHEAVASSRDVLEYEHVPEQLLLIGGGVIGLELGTVFSKLGAEVTVFEMMDQLLPGTDPELVEVVHQKLENRGVDIHLETQASELRETDEGYEVRAETPDGELTVEPDDILLAVGREPNTTDLGLDSTDVSVDDRGFIQVNQKMQSDESHIYAIGDVSSPPLLAHKASAEGTVAAEVIAGEPAAADFQTVPAVIFTDPEIATTGMQEQEAREKGYDVITGKFPISASGRARTMETSDGFVKVIAEEETNLLLGLHIVARHASELITEGSLALEMAATLEDITKTIHPHPTLSESILEAAENAVGQAIHVPGG